MDTLTRRNGEDERIPHNVELTNEQRSICDASYSEIILYYIVNPFVFLRHLCDSIMSMSWKFY